MKRQLFPAVRALMHGFHRFFTVPTAFVSDAPDAPDAPDALDELNGQPDGAANPLSPLHSLTAPRAAFTSAVQSDAPTSDVFFAPTDATADLSTGSEAAFAFNDAWNDPASW